MNERKRKPWGKADAQTSAHISLLTHSVILRRMISLPYTSALACTLDDNVRSIGRAETLERIIALHLCTSVKVIVALAVSLLIWRRATHSSSA
jgi:hypothetical protein